MSNVDFYDISPETTDDYWTSGEIENSGPDQAQI